MLKNIIIILLLIIVKNAFSQELNCRVQVMSQQIQGTNKSVFQDMQKSIYEFMNNTKWTNNVFGVEERIECNILINISKQISVDQFEGYMQITSNRPVYNTNLNTIMINYRDGDIKFTYAEFQPLLFNENASNTNLVSLLAYYAYLIIGFDYDSFSLNGGDPYFAKASKIVDNMQNSTEKGWKSFESQKNRYWIIHNILDDAYSPIREFEYKYHRLGLDVMSKKLTEGRSEIAESLKLLQKVYRKKPDPFMPYYKIVIESKSDEFVNIFSGSFSEEKARVVNILKEIDPANSSKYQKIMTTQN